MHYKELKEKADSMNEKQYSKAKENYRHARNLGFSSRESMLLQFKSKEEIEKMARERDGGAV